MTETPVFIEYTEKDCPEVICGICGTLIAGLKAARSAHIESHTNRAPQLVGYGYSLTPTRLANQLHLGSNLRN